MNKVESKILSFKNQQDKIVYNSTIPFEHEGKTYIGVRVESLDSELDSKTFFAYKQNAVDSFWTIDSSIQSLPLQDPSYVKINNETFILGVKVWQEGDLIRWKQDIYRGDNINSLEHFISGPVGMKDIRLVKLEDRIGVFTRPASWCKSKLGSIGGRGKIGYLEVESMDELEKFTESDWYNAKIIENLFDDEHWGGVNQAIKLPNGEIGVIGHIAYETINKQAELEKHYWGMTFRFNPKTNQYSNFKIIAKRDDFPFASSKRSPELDDVIFPAGIDENNNLYCGISDFCVGQKKIKKLF